jgi:hypothetical protein
VLRRRWLLASILLAGCGTEAPVPEQPTWAEDVLPIMRANCFSCHGPLANYQKYGNKRWDVYDMTAEPLMRMGLGPVMEDIMQKDGKIVPVTTFLGAKDNAGSYHLFAESDDEAARMPPPPATKLSARDLAVLANWEDAKNPNRLALGSHNPNHKAAYRWLDKPARLVAVTDEDGDQVLGKLDCGGTEFVILRSGSHKLPATACTGTLFDGFDETTVNLK